MNLKIAGIHMEVGDALRAHCETRCEELKKFFSQVIDVDVNFHKESHRHLADMTIHASGLTLRASGEGNDFYPAIDDAVNKLSSQLLRYKGRLSKHRKRRQKDAERLKDIPPMQVSHTVVDEGSLEEAPEDLFAEYTPTIVHKDIRHIPALSVDEAVMQMDLLHSNVYIFQNAKSGKLNVVHREPNGTIGWMEPHCEQA